MKQLYKNKEWNIVENYNIDKILYLLIDRPSKITSRYNDFLWHNKKGFSHRNYDLPAVIYSDDGYMEWCINHITYKRCFPKNEWKYLKL